MHTERPQMEGAHFEPYALTLRPHHLAYLDLLREKHTLSDPIQYSE